MTNEYGDLIRSQIAEESVRNIVDWRNPPGISNLEADYLSAKPIQDTVTAKIDNWLELYEAKNKNYGKNRSRTRPKTIKKQAKWTYPVIEEPLLAKKDLFDLEPRTYEDAKANLLNKIIINQQFREEMNFQKFLNDATRIYVNQGTLIFKINWKRKYEMQKVVEPIYQEVQSMDPETGQIIIEQQKVGTQIVEKEIMTHNHPELVPLNYKKIILDPSAKGDMSKMNFIIYEYETNLSNLKKDGTYKNLDLVDYESQIDTDLDNSSFDFKDKPRKRLLIKEYWGYWDTEGTGKTDMIVAVYAGNVMIKLEKNPLPFDELPFEICQFEPVFESNYGEPDAEVIAENQENIGATSRAIIDIMGRSASGQEGMPQGFLDPINRRKYEAGDDYLYNPNYDPKMIYMHTPPELPSSIWNFIEYQNREVDELTGKKPFAMGNSGSAMSSTATAIRTTLDATSKRELGILRRFVASIERAAKKIIAMNRLFLTDGQIFKITNDKYLAINREHLYGQFDIKLKVTTPEETENKIQKISFKLQTLGNTLPFNLTKILLAKEFDYDNDPEMAQVIREFEPQPDPLEQQKAQLEIQLLQEQINVYRSTVQENSADYEYKMAKAKEIEANRDLKDLDFIHRSEGIDHTRKLEEKQQQFNSQQSLEELKAHLGKMNANKNNKRV